MACHIRLASPNALFGQPEVGLGLIPGYGGTQRLPRLVGSGRATEMILTGKPVTAERAEAMGLVNHVVDGEDLVAEAIAMIRKIARQSPTAVSLALAAIRRADSDLQTGLYHEAALFGQAFSTDDFREGVNAFLEKRTPKFSGR
jgi:enoyl-CoA hydratase/carnithine racemase